MQRLWDVERGSGSSTLRAETLDALGGAGQIVADHLERAIDALTPEQREIAARLFDHLVTPSGMKIAHEALGPRRVRRRVRGRDPARRRDAREPPHPPNRRGRPLGDLPRRARRRRARLEEPSRRGAGGRARARGVAATASPARPPRVRRARGPCAGVRARGLRPGAAERRARAGAGRDERAARRERAVADRQRSGAGARAGARGGTGRSESARRGCASPDARGLARAGDLRRRPSARVARSRPLGDERARRRRRTRCPADRPSRRGRAVVTPRRRCRGRVRTRRAHRACRRTDGRCCGSTRERASRSASRFGSSLPGSVERLVPSPDGRTAIVIAGKPRARVVDLSTGAAVGRVKQPPRVTDAAYASSGRLVASAGVDRSARLWDTRTWTETRALRGHVGQVIVVAFDPTSDRVATGSTDQTARIWRGRTGALVTPLYGHTGYVEDVAFGPGGLVVTASGDGTARTWAANGRPIQVLRGHTGAVVAAEFAGRDVVVTAGADGTIRTWDPGTTVELDAGARSRRRRRRRSAPRAPGEPRRRRSSSVIRLRTPDGERDCSAVTRISSTPSRSAPTGGSWCPRAETTTSSSGTSRAARSCIASPRHSRGPSPDARFSPDGRWIVTAGPRSARLWNVADGRDLMYLYGPKPLAHGGGVRARLAHDRHARGERRRPALRLRALRRARRAERAGAMRASRERVGRSRPPSESGSSTDRLHAAPATSATRAPPASASARRRRRRGRRAPGRA